MYLVSRNLKHNLFCTFSASHSISPRNGQGIYVLKFFAPEILSKVEYLKYFDLQIVDLLFTLPFGYRIDQNIRFAQPLTCRTGGLSDSLHHHIQVLGLWEYLV